MKREDDKNTPSSSRRGFLRGALLGGAGLIVSGCVKRDPPQEAPGQNKCPEPTGGRNLDAAFCLSEDWDTTFGHSTKVMAKIMTMAKS